ncbi:MAG: DUF3825 domain-containing protein, partial [Paracoccaceae bacterium]|nr:DUF3825 domain-containing protein [Paracoccaceae bacterium]
MNNWRTDEIIRIATSGDFGFFETELGPVFLHRENIEGKNPPVVGQWYSYQLGEGKDGKLKAYKASKTRTVVSAETPEAQNQASANGFEDQLGKQRSDKVKTVNVQGGFGILDGELGTILLHKNDVDDKSLPVEGETYVYKLEQRDDGKLKAAKASLQKRLRPDDDDDNVEPIRDLYKWAYIPLSSLDAVSIPIQQLADLALDEDWRYRDQSDPKVDEFGVLRSYTRFTFTRLSHEGKIIEGEAYAVFNTGLVDRFYKPIYALFEKNDHPRPPWKWKAFCVAGQGFDGKLLNRTFSTLPLAARYFEHLDDIHFDADAPFDEDINHIVLDGIRRDRYPHAFLEEYAGGFDVSEYKKSTAEYLEHIAETLDKNDAMFRKLHNRLAAAIDLAQARARWNYRAVVPQYYPRFNKMSFLLPLALMDDTVIDAALVVQAERVEGELKY